MNETITEKFIRDEKEEYGDQHVQNGDKEKWYINRALEHALENKDIEFLADHRNFKSMHGEELRYNIDLEEALDTLYVFFNNSTDKDFCKIVKELLIYEHIIFRSLNTLAENKDSIETKVDFLFKEKNYTNNYLERTKRYHE